MLTEPTAQAQSRPRWRLRSAVVAATVLATVVVGSPAPADQLPAPAAGVSALVSSPAAAPAGGISVAAARPRASLSATTALDGNGLLAVTLTSDATRVRLTYRRATHKRTQVVRLAGAPVTVTLPASASDVRARALAGHGLRAGHRMAVAVTGSWSGPLADLLPRRVDKVVGWSYSPDGTQVGFLSTDPGLGGQPAATGALYSADLATGTVRLLSADPAGAPALRNGQPALVQAWTWLPNGQQVAFTSDATNLVAGVADGAPHAYVKDLATGAVSLVSTPMSDSYPLEGLPAWSADGQHMAFAWRQPCPGPPGATLPRRGVFVADLASGLLTPVIPSPACAAAAASPTQIWVDGISAQGNRVLVRQEQAKSYGAMTVHDLGTGRVIGVPSGPGSLSPDGASLLSVTQVAGDKSGASSRVLITDLATGASRVAVAPTGRSREALEAAVWAPDGTRIAFQFRARRASSTFSTRDRNGRSDIYVRDLGTGAMALVSPGRGRTCSRATMPRWAPDGRVGFLCGAGARLSVKAPA